MSYEEEKKEIETIREREVTLKLSDADVKRIAKKAAGAGLSISELLENFIGDLICGTRSNGSDERMYANKWFDRCKPGWPNTSFLQYLVEYGDLDEFLENYHNLKWSEDYISRKEKELETGTMKNREGKIYTWKNITDSNGEPSYSSEEEWRKVIMVDLEGEKEEMEYSREEVTGYWNEFLEHAAEKDLSMEKEIKKILEWEEGLNKLTNSGTGK